MLKFAYNTNGFLSHKLEDAIGILAELGYAGVSITLDTHHLHPFACTAAEVKSIRSLLEEKGLEVVIETGGRYVLDPWRKHAPNLLSHRGAEERVRFLKRAIEIAGDLGATVVSFWSGKKEEDCDDATAYERLARRIEELLPHAEQNGIALAFEPEPGMLVEGQSDLARLEEALGRRLALTLDVGHLFLTESDAPESFIYRERDRLVNVHIEDMKAGEHRHLELGEGEMVFPPILRALQDIEYRGLVSVELSRHSHRAPVAAAKALQQLNAILYHSA